MISEHDLTQLIERPASDRPVLSLFLDLRPGPDHRRTHDVFLAQRRARLDELARGWRQLVLKQKSAGPAIGKPSKASLQLFFMACYDIDRFRAFVLLALAPLVGRLVLAAVSSRRQARSNK